MIKRNWILILILLPFLHISLNCGYADSSWNFDQIVKLQPEQVSAEVQVFINEIPDNPLNFPEGVIVRINQVQEYGADYNHVVFQHGQYFISNGGFNYEIVSNIGDLYKKGL